MKFSFEKVLLVGKKCVPLHPLNEKRLFRVVQKKEFFERFT
jgi:hypothetical protein